MKFFKKKRGQGVKRKAHVSKATKKYVKKVLDNDRENKYFDLSQTIAGATTATDTAGSVVLLSGVQQGQTFATRIGETIQPKRLEVRYDCFHAGGGGGLIPALFRVIIFQDRQIRSSTLPLVTDVLEVAQYNAPIEHIALNAKRFHVLYDRLHDLTPAVAGGPADQAYESVHKKFKLSGNIVYTNSSTGTQKNNIYVLYISNGASTGTPINSPGINMYSRLLFEDA